MLNTLPLLTWVDVRRAGGPLIPPEALQSQHPGTKDAIQVADHLDRYVLTFKLMGGTNSGGGGQYQVQVRSAIINQIHHLVKTHHVGSVAGGPILLPHHPPEHSLAQPRPHVRDDPAHN